MLPKKIWVDEDGDSGGQRVCPVETFGVVIGTSGTAPFIHLQLEQLRRQFGQGGMPTLIVNDGVGPDFEQPRIEELCEEYGADVYFGPYIGHAQGDVRVYLAGFEWAHQVNADVIVKLSRRFIPLVNWRHGLQYLVSSNPWAATFTRPFHAGCEAQSIRTDCIALRVRLWDTPDVVDGLTALLRMDATRVNVEPMICAMAQAVGGYVMWDLLGPDHYRPWEQAMQWRGLRHYHYGDLAREFGLPYTDDDFRSRVMGTVASELGKKEQFESAPCRGVVVGKSWMMSREEAEEAAIELVKSAELEMAEVDIVVAKMEAKAKGEENELRRSD